jgi:hypothetical protein
MTDIRGIHYEISKPVLNDRDGHYYQRVRQVDENGNLVGIGDQRIQLSKPNSLDGQYQRDLDWSKLGKLGGDVGQVGIGALKRDPRMITNGAISFGKDVQSGVFKDYDSWPGTDRPWEQDDITAPPFDGGIPHHPSDIGTPHSEDTTSGSGGQLYALAAPNGRQPDSEGPVGLFSGKPMRFPFTAIFQPQTFSGAASNPDPRSALDDMIWNGLGSRASSLDADPALPLARDRWISSGNGTDSASSSGGPGAFLARPISTSPGSQAPLSLNDAYLEYLRRLDANQSQ